jgi:hypothetical protein
MDQTRLLSSREKALKINLDQQIYGSFAEIGAGQETAAHFFKAGGSSGTIAKTMSAYDMEFSDAIYGETERYVSEARLRQMLEKEFGLLGKRLLSRAAQTCFFAFANTVETTNYHRTNQAHGWLGLRFQLQPGGPYNECIIHVVLKDQENTWQQRTIGIIGVNLLFACFYLHGEPDRLIRSLLDNIFQDTVEIDMFRISGPDFGHIDNRLMSLKLVKNKLTKAAMFGPDGAVLQPSEALYKKNALVLSGRFRPYTIVHQDMLQKATGMFLQEPEVEPERTVIISELSLNALIDANGEVVDEDFLDRINVLCSLGHTVMITNFLDYWYLMPYLTRMTRGRQIAFVLSVRNIERIFDINQYPNVPGGILEVISMLFGQNIRAYAYPALRRNHSQLIRLENLEVRPTQQGLLKYLIDNGKIRETEVADTSLLSIDADHLLEDIQQNKTGWENLVPAETVELIRRNALFGYPAG